jgi:hypothetical protein
LTDDEEFAYVQRLRERTLTLYLAVMILMIIGIAVLALYSYELGPLVGPGVESSFGLAVALMFLMGALLIHLVDWMYRVWPLGRRVTPTPPGPVTDRSWSMALAVLVIVSAGGAIAYILGGLLA